jgi:hypothetical protein
VIWQDRGTRDNDGWTLDHRHVVVTDECRRVPGSLPPLAQPSTCWPWTGREARPVSQRATGSSRPARVALVCAAFGPNFVWWQRRTAEPGGCSGRRPDQVRSVLRERVAFLAVDDTVRSPR